MGQSWRQTSSCKLCPVKVASTEPLHSVSARGPERHFVGSALPGCVQIASIRSLSRAVDDGHR
jgi:hypothetical protein